MTAVPHLDRIGAPLAESLCGRLEADAAYAVRDAAAYHRLVPWFAHAALRGGGRGSPRARDWLATRLREAAAVESARRADARRALERLALAGVPALVLKGAHVAHRLYPAPHLRPHGDLDLLVPEGARQAAHDALREAGYALIPHVRGDLILAQMHFVREQRSGIRHAIDLHWRALNPHAFRHALPFDAAWDRSQPIAPLGDFARGLSDPDALLLACAHLAAHHAASMRLIWLLDVHRLASCLGPHEWRAFAGQARAERLRAVAGAILGRAGAILGTAVPDDVRRALEDGEDDGLAALHLRARSRAGALWLDVRAIGSWRGRAGYLVQHLVPERDYMRHRYGVSGAGVVWAYARRVANGAAGWLRRPEPDVPAGDPSGAAARPPSRRGTSRSDAAGGPSATG